MCVGRGGGGAENIYTFWTLKGLIVMSAWEEGEIIPKCLLLSCYDVVCKMLHGAHTTCASHPFYFLHRWLIITIFTVQWRFHTQLNLSVKINQEGTKNGLWWGNNVLSVQKNAQVSTDNKKKASSSLIPALLFLHPYDHWALSLSSLLSQRPTITSVLCFTV